MAGLSHRRRSSRKKRLVPEFYAAVKQGRVVQSCTSIRPYRYAVLHTGINGTFATFHATHEGAQVACDHMREAAPTKEIVEAVRTTHLVPTDVVLDPAGVVEDDGTNIGTP